MTPADTPPGRRPVPWRPLAALLLVFAAGLALRIPLGRSIGYPTDMVHMVEWADKGARGPLGDVYGRVAPNHAPVSITLFWLVGKARAAFPTLTRPDFRYLSMKAPAILGDLLVAWLLYALVARRLGRAPAVFTAAAYLFNPAVISDSAHWGQTDGLVPLFPLLALAALDRGAWWLVGPACAVALATKFQSVTLVASLLAFVLADVGVLRTLATLAAGALAFGVVCLPFLLTAGQTSRMLNLAYFGNLNAFPSLRFGALNFWDALDPAIPDDDWALVVVHGVAITPKLLGLALFALAWAGATVAGAARRDLFARAYAIGIVAWSFFMFPTEIHERYLLPAVAFLTLAAARGRPLTIAVAAIVSVIHLYSCYFRFSWGADALVPLLRALVVPTFLLAFLHLRAECRDAEGAPARGPTWIASLAGRVAARLGLVTGALAVASVLVALAVGGWFHARAAAVPVARLRAVDLTPDGAVRAKPGDALALRFPPVFAAFRSSVAVTGTGACAATFSVRAGTATLWDSGPVPAGSGPRAVDAPLAPGDTTVTLLAQPSGCPPGTTLAWIDPRLVPWRPADGWGTGDVLYLSDLRSGPGLSSLGGEGRWRPDRSVQGNPITIAGERFARGIGVVADSVVGFRVPDGAASFLADVGYDDEVAAQRANAKLVFTVRVDGREAYRSPELTVGQRASTGAVPVAGARRLVLVVESAAPTSSDHADWGGARFVRAGAR